MKKYLLLSAFLFSTYLAKSQHFPLDTIRYTGDVNKYINMVIMGDGYTSTQQDTFLSEAKTLATYFFGQSPWSHYQNYCNVFAIEVASKESGVKHPNNAPDCNTDPFPASNPNNYFGSTFDSYGIHRLVTATNGSLVADVLSSSFPNYDIVLILANSAHYGGSGGSFAVATVNTSSNEIACHETGHSFGGLADEYWAGQQYAMEKPNMTQENNPAKIKWKNWLTTGTNIGINQYTGYPWYHPSNTCKMEYLGDSFCSVCAQAIVEHIHALTDPVVQYLPDDANPIQTGDSMITFQLTRLMKPEPNTLKTEWMLDNKLIGTNKDSVRINTSGLATGSHTLLASVSDTTGLVRDSVHTATYVSTVYWKINKKTTGIDLSAGNQKFHYQVYPDPAKDILNLSLFLEKESTLKISIFDAAGRQVMALPETKAAAGYVTRTLDVYSLAPGMYHAEFTIGQASFSSSFLKK